MLRFVFLFLMLLPLAFSESVPELPALYYGDINASCNLSGLVIKAVADSNVLDTITVSSTSSGLYVFGGPSYADDKLLISDLNNGTIISFYIFNGEFNLLLGTEDFNAGEVKALHFTLPDTNCSTLFPPAKYSGEISAPCDISGMTVKAYAGTTYIGSSTVSGSSSPYSFSAITVDPLSLGITPGAAITFKLYSSAGSVTLGTEYFSYGEVKTLSFTITSDDCNVLSGTAEAAEEQVVAAAGGEGNTTTMSEAEEQTSQVTSTESNTVVIKSPPAQSQENTIGTSETTGETEAGESFAETVKKNVARIFGMPLDVAIIAALVVVIVVVLLIRFAM